MKKIILGIVIVILVAAVAVLTTLVVIKNKDADKSSNKDKQYEQIAKDFIEALKSKEDMDEFVEKYMDYKGMYAYVSDALYEAENVDEYSELFEEIRNEVSEEELKEVKESYVGGFEGFVNYGLELTLKETNIQKPKGYDDFTIVEAIYEEAGEKVTFYFDFYKGKLVMITMGEGLEYIYEDTAYYSGDNDIEVNLSMAEKRKLNKEIDKYSEGDNKLSGKKVKELIDSIIKIDEEYLDKDVFVGLYVSISGVDTDDLSDATENAQKDRTEKKVNNAIKEMEKVKDYIDEDEDYYVISSINHGIVLYVSVEPYDEHENY